MMQTLSNFRREWFSNIRGDVLSGIVVALALIPEAIGFSVIAGVDPKVGLYASFAIACVAAFVGGRPAMISAATAATTVIMVTLVKEHGLQYLFAATILMGLIQILAGFLKLGRVMRFVSRSVTTGFVNALAILIFMAQLPELIGVPGQTYAMIGGMGGCAMIGQSVINVTSGGRGRLSTFVTGAKSLQPVEEAGRGPPGEIAAGPAEVAPRPRQAARG